MSGTTVYAGGDFTTMGTATCNYLAAIDTSGSVVTAWNPNATVRALAVNGSTVYVGGGFTTMDNGKLTLKGLAAIDTSGTIIPTWNPSAANVYALAVSGTTVYTAGFIIFPDCVAAFDTSGTGTARPWKPTIGSSSCCAPRLNALAASSSTVFLGGGDVYVEVLRSSFNAGALVAIDLTGAISTSWDPNPNSYVNALAVTDSPLYVGGNFTTMGGGSVTRNRLAAIDTSGTGTPNSWDPNANGAVYSLAVTDSTVYAGGDFTTIGGRPAPYFARIPR